MHYAVVNVCQAESSIGGLDLVAALQSVNFLAESAVASVYSCEIANY